MTSLIQHNDQTPYEALTGILGELLDDHFDAEYVNNMAVQLLEHGCYPYKCRTPYIEGATVYIVTEYKDVLQARVEYDGFDDRGAFLTVSYTPPYGGHAFYVFHGDEIYTCVFSDKADAERANKEQQRERRF